MQRRYYRRLATSAIAVLAAFAVIVPYAAFACSGSDSQADCCCKRHQSTSAGDKSDSSGADAQNCVTKDCGCCRPAEPQNVPTETTLIQITTSAIPADLPWFHGGTEFSTRIAGKVPANLAAIPHRILHCSWLI